MSTDVLSRYGASLEVQFSGNAKTYHYLCSAGQWVAASGYLLNKEEARVVIPGKIKDDRLSVSVATVLGASATAHPEAVLPIVSLISPDDLLLGKFAVTVAEQKAAALSNAQGATA